MIALLDNYSQLCTIEADLSKIVLQPMRSPNGMVFYRLDYDIVLLFGTTEFKALVSWKVNGVEKRSEAKIIYEDQSPGGS